MGINLIATIDVDNDGVENDERTHLKWSSLELIPEIKKVLSDLGLRTTWFVRADNQLKDVYGSAAYLLEEYATLWKQLQYTGDEVGWHPHIYFWDENEKSYLPDLDPIQRVKKIVDIREELVGLGFHHTAVRMGEAFHTNETMRAINQLSLKVDASALPGRKRQDKSRWFDWSTTSNEPYFPSNDDYRVPGLGSHLDILEIPITTAPIRTSYDTLETAAYRYLNPVYQHNKFKMAVEWVLSSYAGLTDEGFITITFHPSEVIQRHIYHELYAFSLNEMKLNLRHLLQLLNDRNISLRSVTMTEARSIFLNKSQAD